MDIWHETNWFAVQTKPFRENVAAARVTKLDIETFLPQIRREQLVCGVRRLVARPLFPGYFFAQFCPILSLDAVVYAPGVSRVVGTSQSPIPLAAEVISQIRSHTQADGFVRLTPPSFQPGQRLRVEEGPFRGLIGRFEQEADDGRRVAVLLDAIHAARVLMERRWLVPEN